jgi:uncharacterized protein (TIGR02145 family)
VTLIINGNQTLTANFTQNPPEIVLGSFTDTRDVKVYNTVTIGTQTWMGENLNYETPSDSWCYGEGGYDYMSGGTLSSAQVQANCDKYGRLYKWSSARTACPVGWHLPTDAEWQTLVDYAGGWSTGGTKLKASSPDWDGTDDFGFSALPGGSRNTDGSFFVLGSWGYWWTATEGDVDFAYGWYVGTDLEGVGRGYGGKEDGFSVRCLQD